MKEITALVSRNRKLFFKDKGMLFSSMITPVILIVLYATFLANVYKDSFVSATKDMIDLPDKIIDGTVAAQLAAALLAVSCVTVTFCVNLTMVQDRASGARKDFDVSPVSKTKIYIGYFLSTVLNSLMVNGTALALCLLYILKMGWYMSASDVIFVLLDMILLVLFGSTLSSIVNDSAGVIWKHAFKHCKLSAKDAGAVVGGWNNRKCRVWICVWCIHADI